MTHFLSFAKEIYIRYRLMYFDRLDNDSLQNFFGQLSELYPELESLKQESNEAKQKLQCLQL